MVRVGMVYSRIRNDEKMLVEAAQRKGIELVPLFDDEVVLDIHERPWDVDVVLERSISFYRGLYVLKFLGAHGIPSVNTYEVASRCGDKAETSLLLAKAGVRTPKTRVAFTPEAAIRACREVGYPAVLKPTMGSWARLLAKVDNDEQADMVLEHKEALGNPLQQIYYIQEYVKKPEASGVVGSHAIADLQHAGGSHRDIRAFVVGDETIAAIHRNSPHWITNTAKGGKASNFAVSEEFDDFCQRAAAAVGGGVLALDIMETDAGYTCHEVNHTMEFKNSVAPTGVDIPGRVLDYCVAQAKR
ncbi:MAG: [lysine-biosynthesis-protein LysW]---L-2-aminoadipate ligase [Thermoplasmata archaeon]|nr:[lysine-biosynthesis-protein LysW]---L-2-aminoadipate ligase [Thermoplasmata archaeon]